MTTMQRHDEPVNWRTGIAVVIPCYNVKAHIRGVVSAIGPDADVIYCVDDACPDGSGDFIEKELTDPRVRLIRHNKNCGVGGAVITGYQRAVRDGARVIVKIDGDGQMDPALLPNFVGPILRGTADYTKGNRFWDLSEINRMPTVRRLGNLGLSFMAKASTGYWNIFDPTNGYTAIHADIVAQLQINLISKRYFFETDMLFRLNTMRAVVLDIPMHARYGSEISGFRSFRVVPEFITKHIRNLCKRVFYNYFLRDLNAASIELLLAVGLLCFGIIFGGWKWWASAHSSAVASAGTVMIPSLALVFGLQLALAFLNYDIAAVPRDPLYPRLNHRLNHQLPPADVSL